MEDTLYALEKAMQAGSLAPDVYIKQVPILTTLMPLHTCAVPQPDLCIPPIQRNQILSLAGIGMASGDGLIRAQRKHTLPCR